MSRLTGDGLRGIIVGLVAIMLWYSFLRAAVTLTIGPAFARVRVRRGDLSAFVLSTLVTLALLEAIFRIFFPQPVHAVEFAPWGFWHIPGTSFVHGADPRYEGTLLRGTEYVTHISYNALGMRDLDRAPEKPVGTKRILLLGDSFGEGMEVEFSQTVGQVLERLLNDRADPAAGPSTPAVSARPAPETAKWRVTRSLLREIRDEAVAAGSAFLVANVHYTGEQLALRTGFFDQVRIPWVDLSLRDPDSERALYFYRYDPHWNARGHERAARRILQRLRADDPVWDGRAERYEVINAAMSAFSTCQELMVYRAIGQTLSPDLVLLIYTATDDRNLADANMCAVDDAGRVAIHQRTYSDLQQWIRRARAEVKLRSTFLAWVLDRIDALPFVRAFTERVGDPRVTVPEAQR